MEDFDDGNEEEAEEEGDEEGFDGGVEFDGVDGRNGGGWDDFFGGVGGFGLGEVVGVVGGAVARCYLLAVAVSSEAGSVAGGVGLDGDGRDFTNGVVEGEGDGLYHGVVDGFIVGLLRDCLAASATHCKQGKRHYEGSR